jgi:hypothetical protein
VLRQRLAKRISAPRPLPPALLGPGEDAAPGPRSYGIGGTGLVLVVARSSRAQASNGAAGLVGGLARYASAIAAAGDLTRPNGDQYLSGLTVSHLWPRLTSAQSSASSTATRSSSVATTVVPRRVGSRAASASLRACLSVTTTSQ